MSDTQDKDRLTEAHRSGQAQFDSIREMVEELRKAEKAREVSSYRGQDDEARDRIIEDALSVEVRSGWHTSAHDPEYLKPFEYRILLCTGGPACQIVGELSEDGEPETARLQVQDWFTPWTDFWPATKIEHDTCETAKVEEILLEYARCFYFGE